MTDEIDAFVAAIATNEHAAHTANLVDKHLTRATTVGEKVTITLTQSQATSLQFFACEAACSARRLLEAMEAQLEADALNSLPDELLRVPANDAGQA